MKLPFTSRLTAIALTACMSLGLVASEAGAGIRAEIDPTNFPPISTRALFPGINFEGPGVQVTDWYPVYLWRDPSQCLIPVPPADPDDPPTFLPFPSDHNLVTNESGIFGVFHNVFCPILVEGFGIFEDESSIVQRMLNMKGNVPVYYIHSDDVRLDMTWGDLMGLVEDGCALQGMADLKEILQPTTPDPEVFPGGAQIGSFNIKLNGSLTSAGYEGISFSVHTVGQNVPSNPPGVATVRTFKVKGMEDIMRPDVCPLRQ